eukprot:631439_1
MAALLTKTYSRSLWYIGQNKSGEFGIGNRTKQAQLTKCDWSEKIEVRNIYAANAHIVVEDTKGHYYSAGDHDYGACTVNDESEYILNMTPITYFQENNIQISQVFVNNRSDAPFWKTIDGLIYTSCNRNFDGRVGVAVDGSKVINQVPFLNQFSIKKMVFGYLCSIAICDDGSVYSTGTGTGHGDNGLGAKGVGNKSWQRIECLKDIIDCDFGGGFVIFLSSSGRVFSAGNNDCGQLGFNTKDDINSRLFGSNPTEIEYFPDNASKYMKDMLDE